MTARLENGTLRVVQRACPQLLREAGLYRYGCEAGDRGAETPVDEHNHALWALRYVVSRLDARRMGKLPRATAAEEEKPADSPAKPARQERRWLDYRNEALWTRIF